MVAHSQCLADLVLWLGHADASRLLAGQALPNRARKDLAQFVGAFGCRNYLLAAVSCNLSICISAGKRNGLECHVSEVPVPLCFRIPHLPSHLLNNCRINSRL